MVSLTPPPHPPARSFASLSNITSLNLWGCHFLQDDHLDTSALGALRTLIVAECHKLGDGFVQELVEVRGRRREERSDDAA